MAALLKSNGRISRWAIPLMIVVAVAGFGVGIGSFSLVTTLKQQYGEMLKTDTGFIFYHIIMTSVAVFLLLIMFILMEVRMNRILHRLDDLSDSASQFVKLGMEFTKRDR